MAVENARTFIRPARSAAYGAAGSICILFPNVKVPLICFEGTFILLF